MSTQRLLDDNESEEDDATHKHMAEDITYTVDDVIEHIGIGWFQLRIMMIVGLVLIADASEMMIISILLVNLKCEWNLTSIKQVLISTAVFLGQGLGAFVWGMVGDKCGRKKGLFASSVVVFIFGVASAAVPSYPWMVACRFLVGFGIGGAAQCNVIIAEVHPMKYRGLLGMGLSLFWSIGTVFASVVALFIIPAYSWRYFLLAAASPVLLYLIAALWLPESPRYLFTTGNHKKIMADIKKMCKTNGKTLPKGTLDANSYINEQRGDFTELFSSKLMRTSVLLGMIWFTVTFGYYGIVFLATSMLQINVNGCNPVPDLSTVLQLNSTKNATAGASSCRQLTTKDYIEFMVNSISEFPGFLVALILIEQAGRRKGLAVQFGISGIFIAFLALCTSNTASIVLMFIARGALTGAFQTVYVYTAEVLPTNIRGVGSGMGSMFARLGAMTTPLVAELLINLSFYYVIAVYALTMIVSFTASLLLKVETQGKGLDDSLHCDKLARDSKR